MLTYSPNTSRGLLLAGHERGAGEADERGVGQCVAHVEREDIVLAAVRFVGDDDDVGRSESMG